MSYSLYFRIDLFQNTIVPMESIQLKNIQNIQKSLALLRLKIDTMSKLQNKNEEKISKLIISTIPVVDKKLKESQHAQASSLKKSQYSEQILQIRRKNQESRLINQRQVTKSKQMLNTIKHYNSLHLKQSKKVNDQKIRQLKIINLNQKKSQINLMKKKQEESKAKIIEFRQHKKKELKLQRESEMKQNEEKIYQLAQQMKQLAKQQLQMEQRVKASSQNMNKFKNTIKKVDRMQVTEFIRLKEELGETRGIKSISQAILIASINDYLPNSK